MEKKISEVFEGPESSLRKTFDAAVTDDSFDLPEPPPGPKAAKPRVHMSDNACIACEG